MKSRSIYIVWSSNFEWSELENEINNRTIKSVQSCQGLFMFITLNPMPILNLHISPKTLWIVKKRSEKVKLYQIVTTYRTHLSLYVSINQNWTFYFQRYPLLWFIICLAKSVYSILYLRIVMYTIITEA